MLTDLLQNQQTFPSFSVQRIDMKVHGDEVTL